jgi:hypothetical protein
VDSTRLNLSSMSLIINDPLNYNGQFITTNNITATGNLIPLGQRTREINNGTVM